MSGLIPVKVGLDFVYLQLGVIFLFSPTDRNHRTSCDISNWSDQMLLSECQCMGMPKLVSLQKHGFWEMMKERPVEGACSPTKTVGMYWRRKLLMGNSKKIIFMLKNRGGGWGCSLNLACLSALAIVQEDSHHVSKEETFSYCKALTVVIFFLNSATWECTFLFPEGELLWN